MTHLARLASVLGREQARLELRWMQHALQNPLLAGQQRAPDLNTMVARRTAGEPLQYLLGTQPFGPLTLLTRPPVLIPRPETEDWALRLARRLAPKPSQPITLLDLCTGSACIPLLLCAVWPRHSVRAYGVDVSPDAIQLARDNAALCGLSDAYEPLLADVRDPAFLVASGPPTPFDVITSNPPYIPRREYDELPPSVRDYEDARALLGDPDPGHEGGRGLTFYRHIAKLVSRGGVLSDKGVVVVEVGHDQAREVQEILQREGRLPHTEIWKDPWDIERVVFASRRPQVADA